MGYTPSAVSQHLSSLRKETGVTLMEKSGRGIEVTPAGREPATAAGTALDALDEVGRLAGELRAGRTGSLAFAYASLVTATWVPRISREVRERFPDLALSPVHRDCSINELDKRGDIVVTDDLAVSVGDDWEAVDLLDNPAARFMVQRLHAIAAEEAEKVEGITVL